MMQVEAAVVMGDLEDCVQYSIHTKEAVRLPSLSLNPLSDRQSLESLRNNCATQQRREWWWRVASYMDSMSMVRSAAQGISSGGRCALLPAAVASQWSTTLSVHRASESMNSCLLLNPAGA